MVPWDGSQAVRLSAPERVRVVTRRPDGTERPPVTVWIVAAGTRVYVRSTDGRGAAWFRAAVVTGSGRITAGGTSYDVRFAQPDTQELPAVDGAYRIKYGRYRDTVDQLLEDGPRSATLAVLPA